MTDLAIREFEPVVEVGSFDFGDELLPISAHLRIQLRLDVVGQELRERIPDVGSECFVSSDNPVNGVLEAVEGFRDGGKVENPCEETWYDNLSSAEVLTELGNDFFNRSSGIILKNSLSFRV